MEHTYFVTGSALPALSALADCWYATDARMHTTMENCASMDAWCDICKGELRIGSDKKQSAKAKALWKKVKVTYYKGGSEEAKEFALVGDYQVHRESQITGDAPASRPGPSQSPSTEPAR